jgi:hypothetical protein
MKIEPLSGPSIVQPSGSQSNEQMSARERAITKLMQSAENKPAEVQSFATSEQPKVQEPNRLKDNSVETGLAPSTEETSKVKTEEPLSSQYAVLARKEKALRERDRQLRAREEAVKAAQAPKAPATPSFDESKYISREKLQSDLFGTLSELGLTYDQIAAQATNAPTPEQVAFQQEMKALKDEIKALRGETENTKKTFEQQQQDSYKQAVNQIKSEANVLVKNNPEFETIRETNSVDDVVELIEKTFAKDGILLSVEEAAQEVESYLVDEALKISRIKKIQQRLAPSAPIASAPDAKNTDTLKQPQRKTLTNSVASTRQLSARERALLAFEGKLQK